MGQRRQCLNGASGWFARNGEFPVQVRAGAGDLEDAFDLVTAFMSLMDMPDLRRKEPLGREARRSAGPIADHVRAGGQSEDRDSARSHRAALDPRPRRRGDRVTKGYTR